jgi:hypothetical protein
VTFCVLQIKPSSRVELELPSDELMPKFPSLGLTSIIRPFLTVRYSGLTVLDLFTFEKLLILDPLNANEFRFF